MREKSPRKPAHVFDRDAEWNGLTAFVARPTPHAMLGAVRGRRRMGKTYLLRALAESRGGSYFGATAATAGESLRQFGAALARHAGKSQYRITEPLINFYEAVMRPSWALLESGQAADVWARSRERFAAQVAGPHFEAVCRDFMLGPGRALLGNRLGQVGRGVVVDPVARQQIEIDVAVVEPGSGGGRTSVAMLGEVKWGTVMGLPHLDRLRRARDLLDARGMDAGHCALACFSAAGFSDALRVEAERDEVVLVGLAELYA